MSELEAVLFDLYDTLAWSDWPSHAAFLAGHLGVPEDRIGAAYDHLRDERDAGVLSDEGAVLAAVMEQCGLDPELSRVQELVELEAALLAEHVILYADSLPTLRRLRSAGFQTGVVSNCSASTRPVVDRMGLEEEADVVVLSCEVGAFKPSPAIFRTALEALGVAPEGSMFVDDRRDYLDGAAELGMRTVQIVRADAFGEATTGGDHPQVRDLQQLLDLLP